MGRLGNASGQAGAVTARPIANAIAAAARLTGIEFITAILLRLAVGQAFWHKPSGTSLLAQAFWHKPSGTSLLAQAFWHKPSGTSLLAQAFWHKPSGTKRGSKQ